MSLPPLPDELARFTPTEGEHRALKMFVREYGQACRAAALEEATEAAIDACGFNGASVQLEAHIREAIKRLK